MPFEISTTARFSAAHALRLYDGSLEPVHGHNWRVRVAVSAGQLDAIGVVMDFHELERRLAAVLAPLHNRHLNELPAFDPTRGGLNPTAEQVALHIAKTLDLPAGVGLQSVAVWETDENRAVYQP
jgi:6-pyruvoyltetrahydropterin/6-carboxytetrahydropterin synthase